MPAGHFRVAFAASAVALFAQPSLAQTSARPGYLGIGVQPVTSAIASSLNIPSGRGEIVARVEPGEAAARAGVQQGDVVVEANGQEITPASTLTSVVASVPPGKSIPIKVIRQGQELTLTAKLGKRPPENGIDPGPPPASFAEFQRLAVPMLLAGFFDPAAAQITWDRGLTGGYWKPPLSKKIPGWFTCGLVNGKNRLGGYVGARRFVAVYNNGRIVFAQTSQNIYDPVELNCVNAINNGVLPLAGDDTPPNQPATPATTALGLTFAIMPQGAYIEAVEDGTPAARQGIIPGMVISHVNALPLTGFDKAMIAKLLSSNTGSLTLRIIGKGDVVIKAE